MDAIPRSAPEPASTTRQEFRPPKPPGFFRLLLQSAQKNKEGLGVVVLAGSCLFLSVSMLNHKHHFQELQASLQKENASLQKENTSLRNENQDLKHRIGTLTQIVSEATGAPLETFSSAPPTLSASIEDASGKSEGKVPFRI